MIYTLNGKTNFVTEHDALLIHGPIDWPRKNGAIVHVQEGCTLTLTFDGLAPGEAMTVEQGFQISIYIRKYNNEGECITSQRRSIDCHN
jgi:hypothetical protein